MATTTFIIGNGFDLMLGLKTRYRDFYENIRAKNIHPDNRIYKAIAESPETWAHFELRLGEYTEYIGKLPEKDRKKESLKLHMELEEVYRDLAKYLKDQELKFSENNINIIFSANGFLSGLNEDQTNRIWASSKGVDIFNFITLNYTNTLDSVIENSSTHFNANSIRYSRPLHIHGDVTQDITLGVSDESQISSSLTGSEKEDLIKPVLINSMNDGRLRMLQETINNSKVIVLFGTSIGETDKYIWQFITSWLSYSTDRFLIIHQHDSTYTEDVRLISRTRRQFISNVQEKLLRFSAEDGNTIEGLKTRIFVVHNSTRLFVTRK